jgi:hypothetical protein
MSNLRNNIVLKGAMLTILLMITGVFVAVATVDDQLEASWSWEESRIQVNASNLMDNKYYQIRYYQPNTFELCDSNLWSDESNADNTGLEGPYDPTNNRDGFYAGPKFKSNEFPVYTETLTNPGHGWVKGDWTIVLMKGGNTKSDPFTYANSIRTICPLQVPIPEFQTIALPIVAILGIMLILQSRKRKEN